MGWIFQQKATACISLVLLATSFRLQPTSGFDMMQEEQMRQLQRQGSNSYGYILSLVMMGLPDSLIDSISRKLQLSGNRGNVVNPLDDPFFQNTNPLQGDTGGSDDTSNGYGSNEPIQIRKKRGFSDFFQNSGYNNNQNSNSNSNLPSGGSGNPFGGNPRHYINYTDGSSSSSKSSFHDRFYDPFDNRNRLECPRQVNQGFVYQYSNEMALYPAADIASELLARSLPGSDLLFQCLSRQVVFPSDPPEVNLDEFLATANTTCQFEEKQLWSYESVTFTGRCYPLVNFQETPFFKTCTNRFCERCKADDFFFNNKANLCITEFETVSLWSYCESLLPNRRIVRDRILVPDACTCASVQCASRSRFHF